MLPFGGSATKTWLNFEADELYGSLYRINQCLRSTIDAYEYWFFFHSRVRLVKEFRPISQQETPLCFPPPATQVNRAGA